MVPSIGGGVTSWNPGDSCILQKQNHLIFSEGSLALDGEYVAGLKGALGQEGIRPSYGGN